jgi:hypothetical protein
MKKGLSRIIPVLLVLQDADIAFSDCRINPSALSCIPGSTATGSRSLIAPCLFICLIWQCFIAPWPSGHCLEREFNECGLFTCDKVMQKEQGLPEERRGKGQPKGKNRVRVHPLTQR